MTHKSEHLVDLIFKKLKNYKNKNIYGINKKEIKMLSINFCYGGEEIYEIENLKN